MKKYGTQARRLGRSGVIETETKRVLIAGASGFIGSNLARDLLAHEYEVHIAIRKTSNLWRLNDILPEIDNHYLNESSFLEFSYILESVKPDVLINAIGAEQMKNLGDEDRTWFGNFTILMNIAKAIRSSPNIFLLQSGSSFEYGRSSVNHNPLKEEIECDPVSEYGISKLLATEYLKYLGRNDKLSGAVLRIFNAYGKFEDKNRLIPYLILKSLSGERIVLKNPSVSRDFVHISDIAEAFRSAIVNEDRLRDKLHIFNVGTGIFHSVEEVANCVRRITRSNQTVEIERSDLRPENQIPGPLADINKATTLLGWKPKLTMDEGLKITAEWFREFRELYQNF